MTAGQFVSCLGPNARSSKTSNGWQCRCPAHDDGRASLSITQGNDRVLVHCHAGCTPEAVCAAAGLKLADLFTEKPQRNGAARRIVATYDYRDETGKLLFQVCRFEPKDFRQRKPDPNGKDGWTWKTAGLRRVPFRLPELLAAVADSRQVFIPEGEKDCLALVNAGFAATCNPGGAGKWQRDFADYFRRADVVIVADKDSPGHKHAQRVAESLRCVAATVRVIECPDVRGEPIKDCADYFAAGGQAAELDEFAQRAPLWTPPPLVEPPASDASDFDKTTAELRGEIIGWLMSKEAAGKIRQEIEKIVVGTLTKIGRFFFHSDLRDFDSCMFFDAHTKQLARIRSDGFGAWLSEWLSINRAEHLFRFIVAGVETAALSSRHTTGILPASYWAARPGALYLSNGDGRAVKITGAGLQLVDNGTDGVLFAAGRTLAPWKLTTPRDPFETCALFRNVHCGASHGKDLLRLWSYSFATMPRSKPPLGAIGEVGSGKTRTLKGIAELYGIPFRAAKVEESLEPNFWPNVNEGGLFVLDNADTKCRWLADAVAAHATDGCSQRRKLYKDSETITLRSNSWLAITSANPTFGNDAGLADRLLPFRMERSGKDTSDSALTDEILANRDAALSHIAATLQKALGDTGPTPPGLNSRHPDFAAFAVRIGRALGREVETITALRAAESDKSAFCLENDAIGAALLAYLRDAQTFIGTAAELAPKLAEVDAELKDKLSPKRLGKRLSMIWPHLQKALAIAKKEADRQGITHFRFESAGFAGFQTAFSQNPLREDGYRDFRENPETKPAKPADREKSKDLSDAAEEPEPAESALEL